MDGDKTIAAIYLTPDVYSRMFLKPYYFDMPYEIDKNKNLVGLQIIDGKLNAIYTDDEDTPEFEKVDFYLSC